MATTRIVIGEHVYVGLPENSQQPIDIADLVANMNGGEQAQFFNQFARRASEWNGSPGMQWLDISEDLSDAARAMICDLADHVGK